MYMYLPHIYMCSTVNPSNCGFLNCFACTTCAFVHVHVHVHGLSEQLKCTCTCSNPTQGSNFSLDLVCVALLCLSQVSWSLSCTLILYVKSNIFEAEACVNIDVQKTSLCTHTMCTHTMRND